MLIEQRNARWWNAMNSLSRHALLNGALPWNFYPLVNEYPKSGGSWLTQMLGAALELPNPRRRLPMLRSSMMHGHYLRPNNIRDVVMVWRDGRDVAVSFYHHLVGDNDFASKIARDHSRREMGIIDPGDVAGNMPRFVELLCEGRLHPGFGWQDFYAQWHGHPRVKAETRYEAMLADPGGELFRLSQALGANRTEAECDTIAERFTFKAQAKRDAGTEDKTSFLRKGIAGDWRNHFSAEARQVFDHYCGDALIGLGYEPDRTWVKNEELA